MALQLYPGIGLVFDSSVPCVHSPQLLCSFASLQHFVAHYTNWLKYLQLPVQHWQRCPSTMTGTITTKPDLDKSLN